MQSFEGAEVEGVATPTEGLVQLHIRISHRRLFDPETGWFLAGPDADLGLPTQPGANFWTKKSHPCRATLLLPGGDTVFHARVDFRMFGGMSRLHAQKSFSLSCRKKYGTKRIDYPLFGPDGPKDLQFLVVRNGGSDWKRSYLRDALLTSLLQDESWDLNHQAARPAEVYFNGRYWGVYHLREKINPQLLADRYDIEDKETIDLLEHRHSVKHGSVKGYRELLRFIERENLSDPAAFAELREMMDVDNFQRLQIAQAYWDNRDAGGNIRFWRDRADPDQKWRWILYDVDQGFGLHSDTAYARNTLDFFTATDGKGWPNPPWSTLLHRRLLTNPDYHRTFVGRSLDYLDTDFAASAVLANLETRVKTLAPAMPRHLKRWGSTEKNWRIHLERIREFARHRPEYHREDLRAFAGAGPDVFYAVGAGPGGYVLLDDNQRVDEARRNVRRFVGLPLVVRAVAHPGFRFVGWTDGTADPVRRLDVRRHPELMAVRAEFAPHHHALADDIVITDVHARGAAGDWLRLRNVGNRTVYLLGWLLTDEGHQQRLPDLRLDPGEELTLAQKPKKFAKAFPGRKVAAELDFGLAKAGETLSLFAADGAYVYRMNYGPVGQRTEARSSLAPSPAVAGEATPHGTRAPSPNASFWPGFDWNGGRMTVGFFLGSFLLFVCLVVLFKRPG